MLIFYCPAFSLYKAATYALHIIYRSFYSFLFCFVGNDGSKGSKGSRGSKGSQGSDGEDGDTGIKGNLGPTGDTGPTGTSTPHLSALTSTIYCTSGNIREVLIFANFARTNSRIQESRENYYY